MLETARMTNGSSTSTASRGRTARSQAAVHKEGRMAHLIEKQTARIPSDVFLYAALGAMGWSAFQYYRNNTDQSSFVGQWAPAFLLLGIYNKLVKQSGSDGAQQSPN